MCLYFDSKITTAKRSFKAYKVVYRKQYNRRSYARYFESKPLHKRVPQIGGAYNFGRVLRYRVGATVTSSMLLTPGLYLQCRKLARLCRPNTALLEVLVPKGAEIHRAGKLQFCADRIVVVRVVKLRGRR